MVLWSLTTSCTKCSAARPRTCSHNEILIRTAELDELGNFVLDDLAPGTYQLALRLPDREVIVEALSL